ncbi:MAG: hypothetical protein N3A38_06510 [Planctomycetota bacterium]|nr:hypothetical protein [Planctomycetota bacterium]
MRSLRKDRGCQLRSGHRAATGGRGSGRPGCRRRGVVGAWRSRRAGGGAEGRKAPAESRPAVADSPGQGRRGGGGRAADPPVAIRIVRGTVPGRRGAGIYAAVRGSGAACRDMARLGFGPDGAGGGWPGQAGTGGARHARLGIGLALSRQARRGMPPGDQDRSAGGRHPAQAGRRRRSRGSSHGRGRSGNIEGRRRRDASAGGFSGRTAKVTAAPALQPGVAPRRGRSEPAQKPAERSGRSLRKP